jgi:hypothetical protein
MDQHDDGLPADWAAALRDQAVAARAADLGRNHGCLAVDDAGVTYTCWDCLKAAEFWQDVADRDGEPHQQS